MNANKPHMHENEDGILIKCYHHCKNTIFSFSFLAGITLSFPLEHYLWEKVFPFSLITTWLGL